MPRLASIHGVDIHMCFRDHAPPHVHAFCGDDEALVVIRDGTVLAGAIAAGPLAVVRTFIADERAALLDRWKSFGGG